MFFGKKKTEKKRPKPEQLRPGGHPPDQPTYVPVPTGSNFTAATPPTTLECDDVETESERKRNEVRNTPVINSKYKHLW